MALGMDQLGSTLILAFDCLRSRPPHLASKSDNTASVNEDGPLDDNLEEGNAYESDSDEDGEGEGADIPLNPNRR